MKKETNEIMENKKRKNRRNEIHLQEIVYYINYLVSVSGGGGGKVVVR